MKVSKKATRQPKSSEKSPSQNLMFTMPSIDTLKDFGCELEFSESQIHELSIVLKHIEADLSFASGIMDKLPPRRKLIQRLKNLEKIIHILKDELRHSEKDLEHFLPHDVGSFLGKAMSLSAINDALGNDSFPVHVDLAIATAHTNGQAIDQRQIEKLQTPKRESLGLNHSDKLLPYLIKGIHDPLRLWVELDRLNRGGRSPDMRRRFIIYWLAYYSPEILGRPAAAAITGPFVRLCEKIFLSNGFNVDGLEKVIPTLVKQARADRKKQHEPDTDQTARLQILIPKP